MKKIIKERGSVFGNDEAWKELNSIVDKLNPSKIFVLTDTNTQKHCLSHIRTNTNFGEKLVEMTMVPGESNKNIDSCMILWEQLSQLGADRKSLLINVGGGVVTDLGGFVACTFQRGIEFINVPTSLLAMVDASVGGKNGVDLGALKNQIGIIKNPKAVIVDTAFLNTLPPAHFKSGVAEMLKHGLIHSSAYLQRVMEMDATNEEELKELVWESIEIKNTVITEDPFEQGLRKTLNYGHTLGHAIESFCLQTSSKQELLHGEAIAIGMVLANYISSKLFDFPQDLLRDFTAHIKGYYGKVSFSEEEINEIIKLLIFDKKNTNGNIQFVLLNDVAEAKLDCRVNDNLIHESFNFYSEF
ncbi:MAG: 3-dehydroquinate synthase [Flavobacteriaceae bacterium]|nr:3-dehydroquinate synthase [Flavobacteriaceae bacterium]